MQSDFSHGVLAQNHALSVATGTGLRSADFHISGGSVGDFIPGGFNRDLNASGSAKAVGEKTTFTATARYFMEEAGSAGSPLLTPPSPPPGDTSSHGLNGATPPRSIHEYTLGGTATYAASDRLTHSATIGVDGYRLWNVQMNQAPIISPADSALLRARGGADRATIRGSSVLKLADGESKQADLTVSAEHGVFRATTLESQPTPLTDRGVPGSLTDRMVSSWESNSGLTGQANVSFDSSVFFTGGVRFERDSRLPGSEIAVLPMVGVAAVRDYGLLTVKLRGAYGEGIRPPSTFSHAELWQNANGASSQGPLGPEKQAGTEAGLDVTLGRILSFRATRFDQRASGLIQEVMLPADPNPMSRRLRYELENVGVISNSRLGDGDVRQRVSAHGVRDVVARLEPRRERRAGLSGRPSRRRSNAAGAGAHWQPQLLLARRRLVRVTRRLARDRLDQLRRAGSGKRVQLRPAHHARHAGAAAPAVLAPL